MSRVAPRPLGLPEHMLSGGKTPDGEPWVKWAKDGERSGWLTPGTREPEINKNSSFWQIVYGLGCDFGNGKIDAVHCVGPSLSVGGLGLTVSSGLAQVLLYECFVWQPDRFVKNMFPVMRVANVYVGDHHVHGPVFFSGADGKPVTKGLHEVTGIPEEPGGKAASDRSRLWVSKVSRLLRDKIFDEAQLNFCRSQLPMLLSDDARQRVCWPESEPKFFGEWPLEQRALWIIALLLPLLPGVDDADRETVFRTAMPGTEAQAKILSMLSCAFALAQKLGTESARALHAQLRLLVSRIDTVLGLTLTVMPLPEVTP